jgi:hypothetical protein
LFSVNPKIEGNYLIREVGKMTNQNSDTKNRNQTDNQDNNNTMTDAVQNGLQNIANVTKDAFQNFTGTNGNNSSTNKRNNQR